RADMIAAGWSPSVRLFEAGACATPVMRDYWDGLGQLFPIGEALMVARGADEVVEVLENTTDAACRTVAAAAQRVVLREHTGRARARHVLSAIGFARAGGADELPTEEAAAV